MRNIHSSSLLKAFSAVAFGIVLVVLIFASSCSREKGGFEPISRLDVKGANSGGSILGQHGFSQPYGKDMFEMPYKGPYRLPRNRIAFSRETIEEYPFLRELGVTAGIYPMESRIGGKENLRTVSSLDISHDGFIAPSIGTVRCVVLKVQFEATKNNPGWTNAQIRRRLFDANVSDIPGGSLRDYFYAQSYGKLTLEGDIYPSDDSYYQVIGSPNWSGGAGNGSVYLTRSQWLDLLSKADPDINFANYDADSNDTVDALIIVYRNFDNDDNPFSSYEHREYVGAVYWAGTIYLSDVYADGKYMLRGAFLDNEAIRDGSFVALHEFGHILGLPDLYDYGGDSLPPDPGPDGDESNGNGWWELMAAGNYVIPPQNLSALSKYILAWDEPTNLVTGLKDLRIQPVEGGEGRTFRLWKNGQMGEEYFLLENRSTNAVSLFKQWGVFPSQLYIDFLNAGVELRNLPPGLLIWHVDERVFNSVGNYGFGCNDREEHKFVDLEECTASYVFSYGGRYIIDHKQYYGGTYDPWPQTINSTTYNSFTPQTIPNSNAYDGSKTISISNIRRDGEDIIIDVSVGDPEIEFVLPKAVFSGVISLTPSRAENVSKVIYSFNESPPIEVTEPPFTFEYDVSNLEFGAFKLSATAYGDATPATDSVTLHLIVDNTTGSFPLMETFENLDYQAAGTGFAEPSPFDLLVGGYGNSMFSYGVYKSEIGGYPNNMNALLVLPLIDLTGVENPTLVFRQKYNLEDGKDFIQVVVSTDDFAQDYQVAKTKGGRDAIYSGYRSDWQTVEVNLAQFAGTKIRIGFRLTSDAQNIGEEPQKPAGWWIDNIVVATGYATSIPFITNAGVTPGSLFGLAVQKPQIDISPVAINDPASIVYRLITAERTIEGEDAQPSFNVVIDLTEFRNQEAALSLQPKSASGIMGPAVIVPIYIYNLLGDTDGDGLVNENDVEPIATFLGLTSNSPEFLPWLDPNGDGQVDERDLSAVGYFFGSSI